DKELGGFILEDEEGNYRFEEWPRVWDDNGNIAYPQGPRPDGYVADVHTHPTKTRNTNGPRFSNKDRDQQMWHRDTQIMVDNGGVWWNPPRGGIDQQQIGSQPQYGK
ncbi:MAG: DUF4329 domain-containing protein, partial [Candidatus Omnitrophica bacterium]|nr:DUF4329 domain-containing protein [Candidatus Omnitrophota bacterium]